MIARLCVCMFALLTVAQVSLAQVSDSGLTVRLINDNQDAFYSRWKAIADARETVYFSSFHFADDVFSRAIFGLLLRKAQEGVKVVLVSDAKGSAHLLGGLKRDYFEELAENDNIRVDLYNSIGKEILTVLGRLATFRPARLETVVSANHDKILVVDGRVVIMGSRNHSVAHLADPNDVPSAWRDTEVLFEDASGDLAAIYQEAVMSEFRTHEHSGVRGDWINIRSRQKELVYAAKAMDQWIRGEEIPEASTKLERRVRDEIRFHSHMVNYNAVRASGSAIASSDVTVIDDLGGVHPERTNAIVGELIRLIDAAQTEIVLQTPYFVLSDEMHAALKRAHDRGINIIVHTNSPLSTDSNMTQAFFVMEWAKIRRDFPSIEFYAFTGPRKLHAKVFVFDRKETMVSTFNIDPLSQNYNSEIATVIRSESFADEALQVIDADIENSVQLDDEVTPMSLATPELQRKYERIAKKHWLRRFV